MNLRRIMALLMTLVLALSALSACGKIPEEPIDDLPVTSDAPASDVPQNTLPPITTAAPTTATTPATTQGTLPTTAATTTAATTTEATKKKDKNDFSVEEMSGTMYATISLNIRSGPSTDFDRIGALNEGEAVEVTGRASTGWYRISYNGKTGYVSNVYMSTEKPADKPASTKKDEGVENLDDEENPVEAPEPGSTTQKPTTAEPVSAGDWVKENGAEYMYSRFTESRFQSAINLIAQAVANLDPAVYVGDYVDHDEAMTIAKYIAQIVGTTYCYFDQVSSISGTTLYLRYYVDNLTDAQRMVSNLKSAGDKIIDKISGYSDYNKIKYIYEWIAKNASYGHGNYFASAYGPICDGSGTCVGYAKAGFYLLSRAGFDTIYVCGNGREEDHMWVKVKYDGKWYNVDFGWSDPEPSNGIDPNYVKYDYLLVSDSYIKSTRNSVIDLSHFLNVPAANSDSNSWYSRNDAIAHSWSDVEKILKAKTKEAVDNADGKTYIYVMIQFDTLDLHIETYEYYSRSKFNSEILSGITSKYTCDNRITGAVDPEKVEKTRCLVFRLKKQ